MKIKTIRVQAGFTLVEIMIVVAIIGLLAAIAVPNFIKARATSQADACINNMQQTDGAITTWALETHHTTGDTPPSMATLTTLGYLHTPGGNIPLCPAAGTYTIAALGTTPTVTCSLGATVTPTSRSKLGKLLRGATRVLEGDRRSPKNKWPALSGPAKQ